MEVGDGIQQQGGITVIQRDKYIYLRYQIRTPQNQPNTMTTMTTVTESILNSLVLFATKIDFTFPVGMSTIFGLNSADLVAWYMKPITIKIFGNSIVTPNPMISSDNMIVNIFNKLQQYLSEQNYNYFQQAKFLLYIENGVPPMDSFVGVISSFTFNEVADFPDKFDFTLEFQGKPSITNTVQDALTGFNNDLKVLNTSVVPSSTS